MKISFWAFYLLGATLVLLMKLGRYLYGSRKLNKSYKESLLEWFFEASKENAGSWIATIGLVWVIGVMLISKVDFLLGDWLVKIPLHNSIAFLVGALAEKWAPDAVKFILRKLPGGS